MEARAAAAAGRPVKGILKKRGSNSGSGLDLAESREHQPPPPPSGAAPASQAHPSPPEEHGKKSATWDEMNILATYHPPGKDYGLMKIDEPSTPFRSMKDDEDVGSDAEDGPVAAADLLAARLAAAVDGKGPKILAKQNDSSEEEEDEVDLTPEELEKKRQFEMKRKMHYNEAKNIKFARQLIAKEMHGEAAEEDDDDDEDDDEEEEEEEEMQDTGRMSTESVPAPSDPLENSLEEVCSGP